MQQGEMNKRVFAKNLQHYMSEREIDRKTLCETLNYKYTTVSEWLQGKKYPRIERIEELAKYFGISKSQLIESDADNYPKNVEKAFLGEMTQIPIIGAVAAGLACHAENNIEGYEPVPKSILCSDYDYVYLQVRGNSMSPKLEEGDLVLVRVQSSVDSGTYAVVIVDDEDGVVKKVNYGKNWIELISENPYYPPRRFEGEEVQRIRIFGKVIESKRKF